MKPAPRIPITPMTPAHQMIAGFAKDMAAAAGMLVFITAFTGLLIAFH